MLTLVLAGIAFSAPAVPAQVGGELERKLDYHGESYEQMGTVLAYGGDIDNDGTEDFLIGSLFDSTGVYAGGSVRAYNGLTGSVIRTFDGIFAFAYLGESVACAGDVNNDGFDDVITGGNLDEGYVWVFSGATGDQLHFFHDPNKWKDHYGASVSGAGDVDADGFDDFIIGAPRTEVAGNFLAGAVYVYSGATGALIHQVQGAARNTGIGRCVTGIGDINQDGYDDFAFSGYTDFHGNLAAVYLHSGFDGALIRKTDQVHSTGAMANAGDTNGDGFDDIILGAIYASPDNLSNAGAAYLFSSVDGSLLHTFNGTAPNQLLGWSVSTAGDANADGYADVLVGAVWGDGAPIHKPGFARVYCGFSGELLHQIDGTSDGHLGWSVATAGDPNGDGYAEFLVGEPMRGPTVEDGYVYQYGLNPFLTLSHREVSASAGGTIMLELDFPDLANNYEYRVLASATGTGPLHYGTDIPLTYDSLVDDTYNGRYPFPVHSNLHGTLDADGKASGSASLPAGMNLALIGRSFWVAAVANPIWVLPVYSSTASDITVIP